MGDACAQGSERALQTAAAAGGLCQIQGAGVVLAAAASSQSCSFPGLRWRACLRARVYECARAHVCPDTHVPPAHACSYLLAEAVTGAMAAKDAEPDGRSTPHGGTAAW